MAAPPQLPPQEMQVDRFMVYTQAVIGTGGFGQVFKARDSQTNEIVAAKVIDSRRVRREKIMLEIRLMELVAEHPSFIGLRGAQEVADHFKIFIFMELAPGGELFERVIKDGKLEESDAARYFNEVLAGVAYLHGEGIIHRDLKLENVLLSGDDRCKLIDFGLAHVYKRNEAGEVVREPLKVLCGSKSYAAPEVLSGFGYDGPPVDVWSLGVCLFGMLAGFFPLEEANSSDWRYARAHEETRNGASMTQTIFGLYGRPCPLSAESIEAIDSMLAPPPESRPTAEQMLRIAFCEQRTLTAEQTDQVLRRGAFQLQPKAAAAATQLAGGGVDAHIPGASPVVSFGAQESMAMSFEFGAQPSCGASCGPVYRGSAPYGDGGGAPVYRACSAMSSATTGGNAPAIGVAPAGAMPKLTKQMAFYEADDAPAPIGLASGGIDSYR